MTLNLGYLQQQFLVWAIAGALCLPLVWLAGRLAWLRARPALRSVLELALLTPLPFAVGMHTRELGLEAWLPGRALHWFVAIGLTFHWVAVWWPLLVFVRRRTLTGRAGALVKGTAGAGVALTIHACFVEPLLLESETVELAFAEIPEGQEIRIAHISDLQLVDHGPREAAVVDAVNAFEPDVIVMTGDYITATPGEATAIAAARRVIGALRATHGIWATVSDSDTQRQRQEIFAGLGIRHLANGSDAIEVRGTRLRIGCLDHRMPRHGPVRRGSTPEELVIVGCHTPDLVGWLEERMPEVDLFLSGHTHGGQLQVPFFGPPLYFARVPRHVGAGGVFETPAGLTYTVSRGVGMEGHYAPRFRLNCRPHVFLLRLVPPDRTR